MSSLLLQTYTIALPIVLTSLLSYVVWLLKEQKKDRDANSKGTMLLLREQLYKYHYKYTTAEEIPLYAYENFIDMYDAYHELGGNGVATKLKDEVEKLHLKKKAKDGDETN